MVEKFTPHTIGVIRSERGDTWGPIEDKAVVLQAPVSSVVFGTTLIECAGKLNEMFPAYHPELTRIRPYTDVYTTERTRRHYRFGNHIGQRIAVMPEDMAIYVGGSEEEAAELAEKLGTVRR